MEIYDHYCTTHFGKSHGGTKRELEYAVLYYHKNYGKYMPADRKTPILDIGCGMGHFLYYLIKKGYSNLIGIDVSEEQIKYCKSHITKNVEKIDSLKKYLRNYPKCFSLVVMNDVLEHIPKKDIISILKLIRTSLKKKGVLIIKTPNACNVWGAYVRYADITHELSFTPESLSQVLSLANFQEIKIVYEKHPVHNIKSTIRVGARCFLRFLYCIIYIIEFGGVNTFFSQGIIAVVRK